MADVTDNNNYNNINNDDDDDDGDDDDDDVDDYNDSADNNNIYSFTVFRISLCKWWFTSRPSQDLQLLF